jgi:hypothetical protein
MPFLTEFSPTRCSGDAMSTQNAESRPRFDLTYLPRARALLLPKWRAFPPVASALHAHDCILLACCSIARTIGFAPPAFDEKNGEAIHACLLAARASLEDIDRVLALNTWYQSTALPEQPPCSTAELWRIAARTYKSAVCMDQSMRQHVASVARPIREEANDLSPLEEPDASSNDYGSSTTSR